MNPFAPASLGYDNATVKTLPVDLGNLAMALEDYGGNLSAYFFNTQTGEVLILSEDFDRAQIEEIAGDASHRFLRIEPIDSREGYGIMEHFVRTIPPSRVRDELEWSLEGPKPFRRFKNALSDDAIRAQWFGFHDAHMRKMAIKWLANIGIEPDRNETDVIRSQKPTTTQTTAPQTSLEEAEDKGGDILDELVKVDEEEVVEPLTEEEEKELMEYMEPFPGEGVSFAKLHGLLTALAAGPRPVSREDFLPIITKVAPQLAVRHKAHAGRITDLLERFYNDVVDDFKAEAFVPRLQQQNIMVTDLVSDMGSWCRGFVLGMEHNPSRWRKWFKDARRKKAISTIIATANPEIQEKFGVASAKEFGWTAYRLVSDLVPLIWSYWRFEAALDDLAV